MEPKDRAIEIYKETYDEIYDASINKDYALEKTYYCSLNAIDLVLDFVHPNCVDYVLDVRKELENMYKNEIELS